MNFFGHTSAKVDSKGRVFFPADMRRLMMKGEESRVVMRMNIYEPCIDVLPLESWKQQMEEMRKKMDRWNPMHQRIFRKMVGEAEVVKVDANGRIRVCSHLLERCSIKNEVTFVGMDSYIEIWSKESADKVWDDNTELADWVQEWRNESDLNNRL